LDYDFLIVTGTNDTELIIIIFFGNKTYLVTSTAAPTTASTTSIARMAPIGT
jgi:hypothetical protein